MRNSNSTLLQRRDELRMLWPKYTFLGRLRVREIYVSERTENLDELCEKFSKPREEVICNYWLEQEKEGYIVFWGRKKKKIQPNPTSLPTVLASLCVYYAERLCYCENSSCPAPYFVARRRDQKYCSADCAGPAKRAAKLKWWRKNRDKKVRKRRRKGVKQ